MNQVKFGDYITIQGCILEKGQTQSVVNGLISTTGYTNGELYLEKLPKTLFEDDSKNVGAERVPKKVEDNICGIKNYRDFVFQIWPKLDYDAHKKYSKLIEEKQQIQKKLRSNKDNVGISEEDQESTKEYLIEIREKIKLAKIRMDQETQNNMKQLDNVIGNNTCYGQELSLMHADSNSFLNGLVLASGSEKSAFMMQVSKYFQRGMVFKLMPKYKLRKEGEPIQYKDQIQIFNVKQQCWASFIPNNVISHDKSIVGSVPTNYYKNIDIKKNTNRQRVEVFLTKLKEAYWQLHFHSDYIPPQDNFIRGGDLVYLYHTELQGALSADIPYKNQAGHSEAFIRRYDGEYEQEKRSVSSLWEIEVETNKVRGSNVQVSTLHSQDKGTLQSYKLRHFLTGKVLSLSAFQQKGKDVQCPCLAKDDLQSLENTSRIQFVSTQGDEKDQMESNLCYLIKINNQFMVGNPHIEFSLEKPEKKQQQNQNVSDFKDVTEEMIYKPIADSEFEITRQGLVCLEKGGTEENAFQIIKISDQEKEDILFINSSVGFLQKFVWKLRNVPQKEPQPKKEQIKKVIQTLSDLVFFLVKTESKDPLNCDGLSNVDRQRIMKDFKFIELLVDLLYYPLKLEVYKISELDQIDPDIVKIFKLCNALINHTIKEYRPNEIYASQWIDLLIFQSIMTEGDCDIGSEETLTELIDNNKKILERIDEVTVKKFLKMLYDEQEDKYVKLVRALVLCNGQAVPNQELISKLLLNGLDQIQDDEDENGEVSINSIDKVQQHKIDPNKPLIIQQVKFMKGEVWVQSPFKEDYGSYIRLMKFQELAKESQENQDKFNFFIEMVTLLSNLCKDRNYIAINQLIHIYKRRVCFEIINNQGFSPSLRRSFIMLIHTMYVDISDFKKFQLPNYIRVWTEIDKSKPIISVFDHYDEHDMARLQKENSFVSSILFVQNHLKSFSTQYLASLAKSKYMDSQKEDENHLTISILQMIQQMIDFGFFDTNDQLDGILKNLIKVLNSTIDVSNPNELEFANEVVNLYAASHAFKGNVPQAIKKQKGRTLSRFSTRYEQTEDNQIVQECKVLCCNIVKKIILVRDDMRLTEFMKQFKTEIEAVSLNQLRLNGKNSKKKSSMKPLEIETPQQVKKRISSQIPLLVEKPSQNEQGDKSPLVKNTQKIEQDFFASADEESKRRRALTLNKTALQLINEIFQQNLVKIRGCIKVDVVAIFQDLTLYKYPDLVNISFEILNLLFTERQAIINLLKNVQLLEENDQIQSYFDLKTVQDELTELIEKSENWLFKNDETSVSEAVKVELRLQQLIQMLATKTQNQVTNGDDQVNEPDGERLPTIQMQKQGAQSMEVRTLFGQLFQLDEQRNKDNQELVRNSYIYQQIIDLLKYDASTFSRQRSEAELKQKDFEDNSIYVRILRQCYKVLGRLIIDNPQNKLLLTETILDFMFKHLRYYPQSSVNFVLDPLIEQNPLIIANDDNCRKVIREIILCVNTIKPFQPGLAACYLDTLRKIPYLNDFIVKENQTLIIDYLTNKENANLLSPIQIKEASFSNISTAIQGFQKHLESGTEDVIPVPGEVDYFNSLIYLMAVICDQKNNATESKAQSYVPLQSLRELLILFKNCYYVKTYLYFFFFHVYLDTEKEMSEELMAIKKDIISSIQEDFSNISSSLMSQGFSVLTYKGIIPIQKIKLDYIFDSLLLCIDTILFKKLIEPDQEKQFLVSLQESLILVSRYPTLKQIEKKKLKGIFIQIVQRGFVTITNLREQIQNNDIVPNAFEIRQVQKNLYEIQTNLTVHQSTDESNQLSQKAATLSDIIKKLTVSEEFQESIRDDFKEFVDYFTNIKNISQQTFQGLCTIDFSELTSSMIKFMVQNRSAGDSSSVSNELQKKRLQVLRQIIELEYPENNDPVDLWESMGGYEEEIQKRQNKLVQQGVIEMIVEIIKDPQAPYDLKEESILLGIALLLGGNAKSQQEFLNQLTTDSMNQFLGTLFEIIQKGVQIIKKNMSKTNKQNEYRISERKREVLNVDQNENAIEFEEKLSEDEIQAEKLEESNEGEEEIIPQNVADEITKVRRVYRILQLFCEGHNNKLQNHLRLQIINKQESGKSIDFILSTSIIFSNMVKYVNNHCIHLADQILDFLIEAIQGPCSQNQIVMCRGKVIETCKDFLQKFQGTLETNKEFMVLGFNNDEKKSDIDSLVNKSFKLLYSLIEGDPSPDIVDLLCSILDFQFLMQILVQRYEELKISLNINEDDIEKLVDKIGGHFDESLTEVFDIFLLISTLSDRKESIKEILDNPFPEQTPALQFFKYNTASIEVVFQSNLVRVYFPIQPICRLLSKGTRLQLMEEIPRNTPSEKIEGLVDASIYLFDEMEHLAFLKRQIFNFSSGRLQGLMLFSYFLALIINLTIMFTYKLDFVGVQMAENYLDSQVTETTFILGIIQFIITLFIIVFWVMINGPLILKRTWHQIVEENENPNKSDEEVRVVDAKYLSLTEAVNVLLTKGPDAEEFWKSGKRDFGHMFISFIYYWKNFQFMMLQGSFIYLLFYVTVSAMGLFLSDIVYCLHLLDIIIRFPTLQNVIKAVTTNIGQLGLTTLLGAVIIYIYSIFAFYFSDISFNTSNVFDNTGASANENVCTTLFQCYLYTLNKGLVNGGGIGEGVARPSYSDDVNTYIFRYIFDLTFFMIINITFLNFIFGIIIDTFAQLRDEKQQKEEDKNNVCFICGLPRDDFDQVPGGFSIHIENYHQLWFYLHYIYHLRCKDSTEYNGIESEISHMLSKKNTSWFPLLRALSINQDVNQDKESKIEGQFQKLKNGIKEISSKVDKISLKQPTSSKPTK